jgi:hypothetical protein
MTQTAPWSDTTRRARRLLRLLARNDGVCPEWKLDRVRRSLEPGPELSSFEVERWELFQCIVENLRGADPLAGPGGSEAGIRLLKHLAASGSRQPAAASLKRAGRPPRASPRPGTPSCCRR